MDNNANKCAIDHILDAQRKGEINEDNVLHIVDNLNVAGKLLFVSFTLILVETKGNIIYGRLILKEYENIVSTIT